MDVYVARQPIFLQNMEIAAYELLFRDSMENFMPQNIDGDRATSSVLSGMFMNIGFDSVSGGKKVFINFTENLLLKKIPTIFPADRTVVEILEDIDPSESVINACIELKKEGYKIALDDFVFGEAMEPFVAIADIIKVDFMESSLETIACEVKKLPGHIQLLAEKVETWEEVRAGIDLGFIYFQGYFFSKPEVIKGREISASAAALVELVAETNKSEPDLKKIVSAVSKDVSISYKLLSLINSSYFKRLVEINSIRQALNFLGLDEFRRFIAVLLMSSLSENSISELAVISCVRARFCELLMKKTGKENHGAFTVGLFSMIDAMLGMTSSKVMEILPLSSEIKHAIVDEKGVLAEILSIVVAFEKGEWAQSEKVALKLNINVSEIPGLYKDAVEWAEIIRPV